MVYVSWIKWKKIILHYVKLTNFRVNIYLQKLFGLFQGFSFVNKKTLDNKTNQYMFEATKEKILE